jgi:TPR repeat protein
LFTLNNTLTDVAVDKIQSFFWTKKAAKAGLKTAQSDGDGVKIDMEKAYQWRARADEQGNSYDTNYHVDQCYLKREL